MRDHSVLVAVLDHILEGLQIIDPQWRYLHVNDAAARHGRTTKEALLGKTMLECYPGIEHTEVFALMKKSMTERTPSVLENAFEFRDGSLGHFELRLQPVPQGLCVLSIDITQRKQAIEAQAKAERRLTQAQRMESLGQLAAGVSHDFNNLLTIVLGQSDIALDRAEGPRREDMVAIQDAALAAANLTRQLVAFGRRSVLTREVVDLRTAVRDLVPLLRRTIEARIELTTDTSFETGRVEVDRTQLEQILLNLVVNARDAITGRGRISIAVTSAVLDQEYADAHPGSRVGPHTVLVVQDTGCGMDPATMARIFEPFFTTKEAGRGSGLGLATVYGIVKQHGGNIWAYSEVGSGTSFKIYLPCTDLPASSLPVHGTPVARPVSGATILVVDDMPDVLRVVARMLLAEGHTVHAATSAEDALQLWAANSGAIDLLITDVMLPGRPSSELIGHLRGDRPDLAVLCMSGYDNSHAANAGGLPACDHFLEKPFTPAQLRRKVHEVLADSTR